MKILPDGYTQLEYIQSSGTQYVDTGFKPNQDTRVIMDFEPLETNTKFIFGARTAVNLTYSFLLAGGDTTVRSDYGSHQASGTTSTVLQRVIIDRNKSVTTFGDTTITNTTSTFQCEYNLYLFSVNTAGTAYTPISGKLYSCKIYDNGTLVRNYVPCINAGGAVGLYDVVNDVFYGNAGTGTFTAGPEMEYKEVEYIQSNGTQYIDTGFIPNYESNAEVSFMATVEQAVGGVIGCYKSYGTDMYIVDMVGSFWGTQSNTNYSFNVNEKHTVKITDGVFYDNGIMYWKPSDTTFTCPVNMTMFAFNTPSGAVQFFTGKIYFCQIYNNDTLVRDFIPVVGSDGVAGLWDKVEQVFYGNAGTGAFVAGAIIPEEPEVPPRKITVDLTPPMTGEKTADFNIDYSVTDDIETESFTVVEYIDDEETQSRTVTAGETISTFIESTGMDDGLHTFMLIVDETVEVEYTFYVNNSTTTIESTGVAIDLPAEVNINEKFLISVIVTELSFTIAKLKIHAGDIYSGEV